MNFGIASSKLKIVDLINSKTNRSITYASFALNPN